MNILNNFPFFESNPSEEFSKRKLILKSFKAKSDAKRTMAQSLADWMTKTFGTFTFLMFNLMFFAVWILINLNLLPDYPTFDPYPFNMLTTLVSLEAIILSVFVLISQNRAQRIDDLREEIDLQITVIAEKEVTKIMNMLYLLLEKNGIDLSKDPELKKMLKSTSTDVLEKNLQKELS